jgi:hypothetical protein
MEMSGPLHALAALPPAKGLPLPLGLAKESVWTQGRREKSWFLPEIKARSLVTLVHKQINIQHDVTNEHLNASSFSSTFVS